MNFIKMTNNKSKLNIKAKLDGVVIYDSDSDLDKIDNVFTLIKKKVR